MPVGAKIFFFEPLRVFPYLRASLIAPSFASAPLLQKKTRAENDALEIVRASSACFTFKKLFATWSIFRDCSLIAFTTLGWQCPIPETAHPGKRSRYTFPSRSQTRAPLPLTRHTGTWV